MSLALKHFIYILLSIHICFLANFSHGQHVNFSSWELNESLGDLKIYSKDSTGSLKKFGAEFEINSGLDNVLNMLKAVNSYENWIEGIYDAESVNIKNSTHYSYHFFINRKILFGLYEIKKDGVVNSKVIFHPQFTRVESNIDNTATLHDDYDRIEHYQVKWTFVPRENGSIKVYYEGVVDVQINFAYQLIKPSILENLQGTINNMKKRLVALNAKS